MEENFFETNSKHGQGIILEEYKGVFSLVRGFKSKQSGKLIKRWGYPQKDKNPIETAIPWKIELGDAMQAPKVLEYFLKQLKPGYSEPVAEGDKEIPF